MTGSFVVGFLKLLSIGLLALCLGCGGTDTGNPSLNQSGEGKLPDPQSPVGGAGICAADSYVCPDGSTVERDSTKSCQFRVCPDGTVPAE